MQESRPDSEIYHQEKCGSHYKHHGSMEAVMVVVSTVEIATVSWAFMVEGSATEACRLFRKSVPCFLFFLYVLSPYFSREFVCRKRLAGSAHSSTV